jgi:hypothetical protein
LHADRLQESPVVADRDQGTVESRQCGFQHFDRRQVEMIGRLVQQQQEQRPRPREHASQPGAQALAAAERARRLQRRFVAEREAGQCRVGFVVGQIRVQAAQIIEDAGAGIEQADMLVELGHAIGQAADFSSSGLHTRDQKAPGGIRSACEPLATTRVSQRLSEAPLALRF